MQSVENGVDESEDFESQLEQGGFAVEENSEAEGNKDGGGQVASGAQDDDEIASLKAEIVEARAEAAESKDQMLRLAADCENFKKRMERERANRLKYAEEGILKELLPTIDNLGRAVEQGRTSDDIGTLLEGVEMTLKSLLATVTKYGLEAIEAEGEPFDPNFHEAMVMEESDSVPANHVIKEFEKGYLFKDRLIRAAKVVVAKEIAEN